MLVWYVHILHEGGKPAFSRARVALTSPYPFPTSYRSRMLTALLSISPS